MYGRTAARSELFQLALLTLEAKINQEKKEPRSCRMQIHLDRYLGCFIAKKQKFLMTKAKEKNTKV